MLLAVNYISCILLPNYYASPYTKCSLGPSPYYYKSILLYYTTFLPSVRIRSKVADLE
jgi:hypothetical protein